MFSIKTKFFVSTIFASSGTTQALQCTRNATQNDKLIANELTLQTSLLLLKAFLLVFR
jgi:hypothetical protein